jgi:hypothetical protein
LNQSGFVQFAENNKRHLKELDDFLRDNKQLRVTVVTLHLGRVWILFLQHMLHEINTSFILILHITFIYILIKVMSTSTDGIINFNILQKKTTNNCCSSTWWRIFKNRVARIYVLIYHNWLNFLFIIDRKNKNNAGTEKF